jgi:hypothetical protein
MDKAEIVQLFVCLFVIPFVVLPAFGGGAVTIGYRLARIPGIRFFRSWKVYLASCCYGFLFLVPVGFLLSDSDMSTSAKQALQVAVFCGTQLVMVPVFLRSFTVKSLSVATLAVAVTNAFGYVLFLSQRA